MGEYRYKLDKSSKKVVCPSCNKRRAVQYIDTNTGQPLPSQYAKCDRAENCQYDLNPYKSGYHKKDRQEPMTATPIVKIPKDKICIIPDEYINASIGTLTNERSRNNLFKYLQNFVPNEKINQVFDLFKIGTVKGKFYIRESKTNLELEGSTIFWLLNEQGKANGGELVNFNVQTGATYRHEGERCTRAAYSHYYSIERKSENGVAEWIQKFRSKDQPVLKKPILFGLHQLKNKPLRKPIAIVEAPKTAIIASCFYPEFTWMATMSLGSLTIERLQPLKNHRIVLFPDKGKAFKIWNSKAKKFNNDGFMIHTSKILEKLDVIKQGDDLADILKPEFIQV